MSEKPGVHGAETGGSHGKSEGGMNLAELALKPLAAPFETFGRTITRREFFKELTNVMYTFFGGMVTSFFRRGKGGGGKSKGHAAHH